ncbi:bacterial transferase hexapeptide family protein [Burkholderia cepacia]|nr:bacterial transferase hexapeptide family protein [Burkholderia cepacia]
MLPDHPWAKHFIVLGYRDGAFSAIPNNFFRTWVDEEAQVGTFHIGRCSSIGVGSIAKYDQGVQKLVIGKHVAGGMRLRFLLNGQHEMRTISTSMFSLYGNGLTNPPMPQYADTVIHNDVWIGDEALFLGGSQIESGCVIGARAVIPPNFRTEAYGIYAGSPARLIRFRFTEKCANDCCSSRGGTCPSTGSSRTTTHFWSISPPTKGAHSTRSQRSRKPGTGPSASRANRPPCRRPSDRSFAPRAARRRMT